MDYLLLPDKKCKRCKHLDSSERASYKCYGSPECPAVEVQIVIKSKLEEFAKQYVAAEYEGNLLKQKQIIDLVLKESVSAQQEFNELVLSLQQNRS